MEQGEKRIAVLIDADNVSADYIQFIFDEVSNHGAPTLKRIYGDFTQPRLGKWKTVLLDYSIIPIQQYSYTYGKNSTDSALIIDAMDILYSQNVDGFCIVSSDSDFTRLAARLREAGMTVIGMGERKTPTPFVNACEQFKFLEVLAGSNKSEAVPGEEDLAPKSALSPSRPTLSKAITAIIDDVADADGWASLGSVGQRLNTRYPAFDSRNYGFKKLSHLVDSFKRFEVQSRTMPNQHEAQTFIRDTENKPYKSKFAEDGKHGKKGKKTGKDAFSDKGKKDKDSSKKKKGGHTGAGDAYYDTAYPAGDNVAAVAESMFASVPPVHVYSEPPLREADAYVAEAPIESAAERARRNGFMTVDEAIALFATNPEATVFVEDEPETEDPAAEDAAQTAAAEEEQAVQAAGTAPESLPPDAGAAASDASQPQDAAETVSDAPAQQGAGGPGSESSVPHSDAKAADAPAQLDAGGPGSESSGPHSDAEAADAPARLDAGGPGSESSGPHSDAEAAEAPARLDAGGPGSESSGPHSGAEAADAPAQQDTIGPGGESSEPHGDGETAPEFSQPLADGGSPDPQAAGGEAPERTQEAPKKRSRRSARKEEPTAGDPNTSTAETEPSEPKKRTRRTTKKESAAEEAAADQAETPKRRTRGSAKKDTGESAVATSAEDTSASAEPAETEPPKKRTRRSAKKAEEAAETAETEAPKKRARRSAKKTEDDAETAEAEVPKKRTRRTKAAAEDAAAADEAPKKRTRTKKAADDAGGAEGGETAKKRTRRSAKKTEDEAETVEAPKKRTRRTKAAESPAGSELTDVLSALTGTDHEPAADSESKPGEPVPAV